jgi:peptidyl-prolyl cis-trans isomerase C
MKISKKSLVSLCAVAALLAAYTSRSAMQTNTAPATSKPAIKASDLFTNDVVAKGKGVSVTRSQLDDALISIKTGAAARNQTIPPEQMAMLPSQVLQRLIQLQLLTAKATDADRAYGKEQVQKRLPEIKARAGSDDQFEKQLKSIGMTESELTAKMAEELTADAVLRRELKVNVSDDEVKKFYDENPGQFEEPEMVRAAHILIGTRDSVTGSELSDEKKAAKKKIAEDVLKRARSGEDFAALAKEYSEDPGSKDKGGEYTFPRGKMVPEFEAAAFSLNTNQVSDIVTTQFGYHIIKLYEKLPAKKVELAKVKDDIKDYLSRDALQKQVPDYLEKLQKDANIQILDEKLKPAEMPGESPMKPAGNLKPAPGK